MGRPNDVLHDATALLTTSKTVYAEARPIFFSDNTFLIHGTSADYEWCLYDAQLNISRTTLASLRPTEFDRNGMIKSRRMPLGYAAKMYIYKSDKDSKRNEAQEDGWYY